MGWAILSELHQISAGQFSARSFPNWGPRPQPEDIASLEPSTAVSDWWIQACCWEEEGLFILSGEDGEGFAFI